MARYVWDGTDWVEPIRAPRVSAGPMILRDLPAYRSPLGDGWIEGRAARREHFKRTGTREADPSEWKPSADYAARKAALKAAGK